VRLKRRLREVIRTHQQSLRMGFDVIVLARDNACALSYAQVRGKMVELWRAAGLLMTGEALPGCSSEE